MRALTRLLALAAATTAFAVAPPLLAQEPMAPEYVTQGGGFGVDRPFVLSLENLGGISRITFEPEGGDSESVTQVGTYFGFIPPFVPLPRLGLHYFVAPPISIGAILHYSDNDILGTNLLAGVRIGAGIPLSESTAVWIRGGIAYVSHEIELLGETTFTDVRPGGEVLLVLSPVEHFAFLVGGMFEIGIAGKQESESALGGSSSERDYEHMEFGLTLGILADF